MQITSTMATLIVLDVVMLAMAFSALIFSLGGAGRYDRRFTGSFFIMNLLPLLVNVFMVAMYPSSMSDGLDLVHFLLHIAAVVFLAWASFSSRSTQAMFTASAGFMFVVWVSLLWNIFRPLFRRGEFIGIGHLIPLDYLYLGARLLAVVTCFVVLVSQVRLGMEPQEFGTSSIPEGQVMTRCPHCGNLSDADAVFCMHCGQRLG